jgi:hypothetical protein
MDLDPSLSELSDLSLVDHLRVLELCRDTDEREDSSPQKNADTEKPHISFRNPYQTPQKL